MTLRKPLQHSSRRLAFTLMEMLIVVAIIVALAGIGVVYVIPQFEKAKDGIAKTGAVNVGNALQMYYKDYDTYPGTLQELTVRGDRGGPYIPAEGIVDPWGRQYDYNPNGTNNQGAKPDVWATNPKTGVQIGNWGK
jgi:general secretion pathway protein G